MQETDAQHPAMADPSGLKEEPRADGGGAGRRRPVLGIAWPGPATKSESGGGGNFDYS